MTDIVISSKADGKQLAKLEKRIEANTKAAWRENGLIMLHIRNSGLYKAKYGTFEGYLKERWDIAKQTGYQQLAAAEFIQKLEHSTKIDSTETSAIADKTATVLPANEGQVRPLLTCLNHDGERLKVWQDVVQDGEKITASLVQRKVDEFKASGLVVEDVEIKLPSVTDKDLLSDTERAKREKQQAREAAVAAQMQASETRPTLALADAIEWLGQQEPCDLLLTDPPYSTDVEDIAAFAKSWLPLALSKVKPTGRAFIFIGAYPAELAAYLATAMPEQVLVWTYRNTLGPTPSHNYKLNWQAILYFKGVDAPPLDCPVMLEQFSVQDINAPDGRQGDRYHAWQKPIDIADRFIRHSTKQGDTVLDPFACTGTFLIAAAKLGRIASGCDISAENITIAEGRGCLTSKAI